MNQDRKSEHNDLLSDLEIRKIESEIAKNRAEEKKSTAETQEVEKRLSQWWWYSKESLVKWVVGGIVAAGLLAVWIIGYFQPILQKDQEIAKLENKRLTEENLLQRQENEQNLKALGKQNDSLSVGFNLAVDQATKQQANWKEISEQYRELAKNQQISEKERARFATLATKAEEANEDLKNQINQLKTAQTAANTRSEKFASEISKIPKLVFYGQSKPRRDSITKLYYTSYTFRSEPSGALRDISIKMKFDGTLVGVNVNMRGAIVEESGTRKYIDTDSSGFSYNTGYLREGNDIFIEVTSKKQLKILSMNLSP
jgi:hypothetical protein